MMTAALTLASPPNDILTAFIPMQHNYLHGSEARFYKLSSSVGLKLYQSNEQRNHAFNGQLVAAHHSIGPKVGIKLEVPHNPDDAGDPYQFTFGYTTEVGEPLPRMYGEHPYPEIPGREELERKLKEIGLGAEDCWYRNLATLNGKLIAIDFGVMSGPMSPLWTEKVLSKLS